MGTRARGFIAGAESWEKEPRVFLQGSEAWVKELGVLLQGAELLFEVAMKGRFFFCLPHLPTITVLVRRLFLVGGLLAFGREGLIGVESWEQAPGVLFKELSCSLRKP